MLRVRKKEKREVQAWARLSSDQSADQSQREVGVNVRSLTKYAGPFRPKRGEQCFRKHYLEGEMTKDSALYLSYVSLAVSII